MQIRFQATRPVWHQKFLESLLTFQHRTSEALHYPRHETNSWEGWSSRLWAQCSLCVFCILQKNHHFHDTSIDHDIWNHHDSPWYFNQSLLFHGDSMVFHPFRAGFLAGNLWYWLIPKSSPDFAIFTNINYTHCDKICLCVSMGFNWYMMYVYILHTQGSKSIYPNKEISWIDSGFSTVLHKLERKQLYLRRSVPFSAQRSRLSPNPFPQDASGTFSSRKAICLLNFTLVSFFQERIALPRPVKHASAGPGSVISECTWIVEVEACDPFFLQSHPRTISWSVQVAICKHEIGCGPIKQNFLQLRCSRCPICPDCPEGFKPRDVLTSVPAVLPESLG